MEAITLSIISHERLVKNARLLMKLVSQDIRDRKPNGFNPALFADYAEIETSLTGKLMIRNRLWPISMGNTEAQECGGSVAAAANGINEVAIALYLIGGDHTGKELQVVGVNLLHQVYALARPIRQKKGVLIVGGKPRPIEGDAPPFLIGSVDAYLENMKGRLP